MDTCVSGGNDRRVISEPPTPHRRRRGGLRSGDRDGLLVSALADPELIDHPPRGLRSSTPAATTLPAPPITVRPRYLTIERRSREGARPPTWTVTKRTEHVGKQP